MRRTLAFAGGFLGGVILAHAYMPNAITPYANQAGSMVVLSSIPAAGPGVGICRYSFVGSTLTRPPGTAGTCSEIQMCGTSATYKIISTNIGNGC